MRAIHTHKHSFHDSLFAPSTYKFSGIHKFMHIYVYMLIYSLSICTHMSRASKSQSHTQYSLLPYIWVYRCINTYIYRFHAQFPLCIVLKGLLALTLLFLHTDIHIYIPVSIERQLFFHTITQLSCYTHVHTLHTYTYIYIYT